MPRKKLESPQVDEPRSSRSRKPTEKALALAQTEKIFSSALKPKTRKSTTSPAAMITSKSTAPLKKPIAAMSSAELVLDLPKLTPSQIKSAIPPVIQSENETESLDEPPPEIAAKRGRGRPRKKTSKDDADSNMSAQFDESNSMHGISDALEVVKPGELVIDEDSCSSRSGSQDSGPFYGTVPMTLELDTQVLRTVAANEKKAVAEIEKAGDTTSENIPTEHSIHPPSSPEKPLKKYPPARSRKIPVPIIDPSKILESPSSKIDLEVEAADINDINMELTFQHSSEMDQPTVRKPVERRGRPRKGESVPEKPAVERPAPTRKSLRSMRKEPSQEPDPIPVEEISESAQTESQMRISLDSINNEMLEATCRRMTIPITAMQIELDTVQLESDPEPVIDANSMDIEDIEEIPAPEYERIDGTEVEVVTEETVVAETPEISGEVETIEPQPEVPNLEPTGSVIVDKLVEKIKERPQRSSSRNKKPIEIEKVEVKPILEKVEAVIPKPEIPKKEVELPTETIVVEVVQVKSIEVEASCEKSKRSSSRTKKIDEIEKSIGESKQDKLETNPVAENSEVAIESPKEVVTIQDKPIELEMSEPSISETKKTSENEELKDDRVPEIKKVEPKKEEKRMEKDRKDENPKKESRKDESRKDIRKEDVRRDEARKERSRREESRREESRRDDSKHRSYKKRSEDSKYDGRKKEEIYRRREKSDSNREKSSTSHSRDDRSDSRRDKDRSSHSRDDRQKSKCDYSEKDRSSKSSTIKQPIVPVATAAPKANVLKDVDVMKMEDIMLEHKRAKERARVRKLQKEQKNKEKVNSPKVEDGKSTPIEETEKDKEPEEQKPEISEAPVVDVLPKIETQPTIIEDVIKIEEPHVKVQDTPNDPNEIVDKDQELNTDKKEKSKKEKPLRDKAREKDYRKDKSRFSKQADKDPEDRDQRLASKSNKKVSAKQRFPAEGESPVFTLVESPIMEPEIPKPPEITPIAPEVAPPLPPSPPEPVVPIEDIKPELPQDEPPKQPEIEINEITTRMSTTLEIIGPTTAECSAAIEYEMSDQIEKMSIAQPGDETTVKIEESLSITEFGQLTTDDTSMPEETEVAVKHVEPEAIPKKDLSESMEDSENLRRSSRIKTISSSKQRTVGHGLVRDRDKLLKMMNDSLTSDRSSPNLSLLDDSGKPMKVKSRWRRSSELEMGLVDDTDEYMPEDDVPSKFKSEEETDPEKIKENERIVEEQLKLFQHINENIYHCDRNVSKETRKMMCDCFLTREEIDRGELGCGEDCLNRLLMIECGQRCVVAERCTNKRFQKQQNSDVHVFRTEKKGCGIKASRVILPGDFIMEYVGEVLNSDQFEKRAHEYSKEKNKHYYFMALRSDCIIDATLKGNVSRFINHSCDPNAETQKWTVNGELRIGFFSVRTIMPGEEIVFDYQFQRYGKQAQKCFCEAENCRGWIGEEPDSDESELEEEEYDEDDEEEKSIATADADGKSSDQPAKKVPKPPRKPKVKVPKPDAKRSRKIRKDLIDDVGLDEEIDTLVRTGLKNQAHTLKFSRLMVRAESIAVRRRLLNLLLYAELPCRRLFLDYYGLRLLHGWMCGIASSDIIEILKFKLTLLEVLEVLPITNKTMLKDSKVISTVEGWITKKTAGAKKEFFTQDPSPTNDSSSNSSDLPQAPVVKQIDTEFLKNMPDLLKQSAAFVQDMDVEKLKQIMESCDKMKEQEREKELVEPKEVTKAASGDDSETALVEKINKLCRKLLAAWETLKEVFKIPKKERIEQMKEHEREADMRYKALGLADEDDQNQQRYKSNPLRERRQIESFQQKNRDRPSDSRERHMSKHQRRHLFEVRVAQEEAEKRKHEMWLMHETTCLRFGLNPRQVAPQDIPGMMNVYTEQYYTMDHRPIPTPPSHAFLKFKKPPLSTNPADYILPFMDLPPMWKYAIDDRGRLYYYHIKIRVPQWEPPIKLLPLNNDGQSQDDSMSGNETTDDDTSTTDTNDSSEDELEQKLQELQRAQEKRKKALADQGDDMAKTLEILEATIDADGDELFGNSFLLDRSMEAIIPSSKKRRRKRDGLVQERLISPRTDEDRAYGQMEMKRYRETKEKLRRRKEEARRKKAMAVVVSASTSSDLPRQLDEKDDDDDEEDDATTGILDADDVDIEKTTKKKTIVDELEILRKSKPRKHSNVYEEWKKQELKMKMEKRRSAGKGSSKTAKRAKISESISAIDYNSEEARKIKDKFRVAIASVIVQHLGPYRKDTCEIGKITNNEDFKHLARKLTHFVMLKELKHNHNTIRDLVVTESVKTKAREFIKKYMAKYGGMYVRGANEPDFKD